MNPFKNLPLDQLGSSSLLNPPVFAECFFDAVFLFICCNQLTLAAVPIDMPDSPVDSGVDMDADRVDERSTALATWWRGFDSGIG